MEQLPRFSEPNGLTMVDLFCGAGVGACGFKSAGYDILYAFDNAQHAVSTYNKNIGNHAVLKDAREILLEDVPDADVFVGGFPCTSFSVAGKGLGTDDPRYGDLSYHFYRLIIGKMPKAFIMENVKGLASKKHRHVLDKLMEMFDEGGYNIVWRVVDCAQYGIPQKRERVIAVGIRKDLNICFKFPEPTGETVSLRMAIGDLPEPNGENNHRGYGLRKDELPFIDKVPIGGNWKDLPNEEDKKAFLKNSYYQGGGRTGFLRKMDMDKPALTITSQMNGKFNAQIIDPVDKYGKEIAGLRPRRYTVRECLRLQTVPDWFSFSDDIPLVKQYERCSGIPSKFAHLIGSELATQLK